MSEHTPTGNATGVRHLTIDSEYAGQRLDNFLRTRLKGVPKSAVYRAIRKGEVRINGKRCSADDRIAEGDVVRIPPMRIAETVEAVVPTKLDRVQNLTQRVLYEDDQLLIIDKPSGMAVHGGSGLSFGVIEALRALRPELRNLELVHRLDRDTSGVLMLAKKRSALKAMHVQLQQKQMDKRYLALVKGTWPERVKEVDYPLHKNVLQSGERVVRVDSTQGKPSCTRIRVVTRYQGQTLIEASPITGRTHQIRVHCSAAGHGIAGDDKYGTVEFNKSSSELGLKRLFLHAATLRFNHPQTGARVEVSAPLDEALKAHLGRLQVANG
ncbi:MAG: 23S rRNA pseudouridine(955/2504/2580) synthase RluC [Gammaproteobacteria bacterium]|nr:23S rRNA pseudouridine(955/2504/2580) synthase RluC [Gammaproteobacteria bacterium]